MIQLIFTLLIIGLLWFFMGHHEQNAIKDQIKQELPTSDTIKGLHSDVQRAQTAADNANDLIKKQEKDAQHAMKQIE